MTEQPPNRKHLILDAACRAIARTGAAAVRVSDVAREAGVSTALVHYYFPSRADVILQAFGHADDLADAVAEAQLAELATGRERAERLILTWAGDDPGHPHQLGGVERDVAVRGPQRGRPGDGGRLATSAGSSRWRS